MSAIKCVSKGGIKLPDDITNMISDFLWEETQQRRFDQFYKLFPTTNNGRSISREYRSSMRKVFVSCKYYDRDATFIPEKLHNDFCTELCAAGWVMPPEDIKDIREFLKLTRK